MRSDARWLVGVALLFTVGCSDGGTGPAGENDGARLAAQFEQLADSVDGSGYSPTAEALRHAAEIVRLTGHATPVALTIDGTSRSFLAVGEQLDIPNLVCSWPSDSGSTPPGDTVVVHPGGGGGTDSSSASPPPPSMDSVPGRDTLPNPPPTPECTQQGTFSMRTLIAWEPERMNEVVRLVADVGSNVVEPGVPDVMTGLPTGSAGAGPTAPGQPAAPNDSGGGTGGGGGGYGGYPGFMGEYLVRDQGAWYAVEGSETNSLQDANGACTADRASFDWAEFRCEAARFGFEFRMRVEPLRIVPLEDPATGGMPGPMPGPGSPPAQPQGDHVLAMAASDVDGVRLMVVAWMPPPVPPPGPPTPLPPDSMVTGGKGSP